MTRDRDAVWRQGASVAVATGLYGISFGALAAAAGLSWAQACALSLLVFTGGSQFAFVGVVGAGGAASIAVATAAMLGIRNGFYSLQLGPVLRPSGWRRIPTAQLTIDESAAVATAQKTPELSRLGFWVTGLGVYLFWNLFTLVGALIGDALGDPRRYGLDAAAAAAFLALLWPRLAPLPARLTAGAAALLALALVPVTPAGVPVLAAAAVGLVAGRFAPDPEDR